MKQDGRRTLKAIAIKVKEKVFIDLFLREGISMKSNYATFITLSIYKDGRSTPIHLTKPKAAQLSVMLNQLVAEGSNADYEKLKEEYPNQKTHHIY